MKLDIFHRKAGYWALLESYESAAKGRPVTLHRFGNYRAEGCNTRTDAGHRRWLFVSLAHARALEAAGLVRLCRRCGTAKGEKNG